MTLVSIWRFWNLPVATLGSADDIIVGGVVVAAGFPLGPDLPGPASFTQGIVSAIRTIDGQRYVCCYLATRVSSLAAMPPTKMAVARFAPIIAAAAFRPNSLFKAPIVAKQGYMVPTRASTMS